MPLKFVLILVAICKTHRRIIFYLNLLLFALPISCTRTESKEYVILSGDALNPDTDSLIITAVTSNYSRTIKISDNLTFCDTIWIKEGYYYAIYDSNYLFLFLAPGYNLRFKLVEESNLENPLFEGIGAAENNYLMMNSMLVDSIYSSIPEYPYFWTLEERDFIRLHDSIYKLEIDLLYYQKNLSKSFLFYEKKSIEFAHLTLLSQYEEFKRGTTGDWSFKVSDNFPDLFKDIDLVDKKLLKCTWYDTYVEKYIINEAKKKIAKSDTADFVLAVFETMEEQLGDNQQLIDRVATKFGSRELFNSRRLDEAYNIYDRITEDSGKKEIIRKEYLRLKKASKGAYCQNYYFRDLNNKDISIFDLKGKPVYIHIWATWCSGCMKDLPALKELEESMNEGDIFFLSICTGDNLERFETIVREKNLLGIQVFLDGDFSILKDFTVISYPRYILLDKDGKIADPCAKRPYDPALRNELLSLQ